MNILFVCHRLPFPPKRGGKIRPFNMIRHLNQTHRVVVASLAESKEELKEGLGLQDYCAELIAEVLPPAARWLQAVAALFSQRPSSVAYFWSAPLYRRIQQTLAQYPFDAVFIHCAFVAQYVENIRVGFQNMDFGDLDSAKWQTYSQYRRFPLSLGYRLESTKLRAYERNLAQQFSHCSVTTQGELEEYQTMGVDTPCVVIPNGVDTSYFSRVRVDHQQAHVLVFLGRMDYFPNIDGILYFTHRIFHLVQQVIPNVQLRIIGSNPGSQILKLSELPGVTVTGHVNDVRPYLQDAAVSIAPLRIARGTQNKILESMAMGIPVVATAEAAKGIQAVPGRDLLVGGNPVAFANQVINLLQDKNLRDTLAEAGQRQIATAHAWPTSMKVLDKILLRARPSSPSSTFQHTTAK